MINRFFPLLCLLLSFAALPARAEETDNLQKVSAIHFMFIVNSVDVKKLLRPNDAGDATCKFHGEIGQMFNPGPGQAVFKTGDTLTITVGCSQSDYTPSPGTFGLGRKALTAGRIEFWGNAKENRKFIPFDARY